MYGQTAKMETVICVFLFELTGEVITAWYTANMAQNMSLVCLTLLAAAWFGDNINVTIVATNLISTHYCIWQAMHVKAACSETCLYVSLITV